MIATAEFEIIVNAHSVDTDALRKQFAVGANAINYVATILDGRRSPDLESHNLAVTESTQNLITAIIEHPLADALGEYRYSLNWAKDKLGITRLKSIYGYLDEIIEKGATDTSGQIPAYELKRNAQNGAFLEKLTEGRRNGDNSKYLEFSPTPLVEESMLKERGYRGNDTILLYDVNADGTEDITQYWFPRVPMKEWKSLFTRLGITTLDEITQISDIDIMANSGSITDTQYSLVMEFIATRSEILEENRSIIETFMSSLENRIFEESQSVLLDIADYIENNPNDTEGIKNHLTIIDNIINEYQFEAWLFINANGGNFDTGDITHEQFVGMSEFDRMLAIEDANFIAAGCGFGGGDDIVVGNFSSIVNNLNHTGDSQVHKSDKYPDHVTCAKSGCQGFYVKNGDTDTYREQCPLCGSSARC